MMPFRVLRELGHEGNMKKQLLNILQNSRFKNSWSTSPETPENVDLNTPHGQWTIRTWDNQQKVKVTRKGVLRSLLGITKGRWVSLADFEVWLQDLESNLGEGKFPNFKRYFLNEDNKESTS